MKCMALNDFAMMEIS